MHSSKRSAGSSRRVRATREQVLAGDVEGELAAVDDGLLDRVLREQALLLQGALELVGDLVEPAAVGAGAGAGQPDGADQAAVAGGVAAVVGAEHAALDADHLAWSPRWPGSVLGVEVLLRVAPLPFCSLTAAAPSSRSWAAP